MSVTTILKKLRPALGFILAVCFLNVLLNIRYPASDLPLWTLFKLAPEILGLLLILWLAATLKIRFRAPVYIPLTALVIFLRLFRIGDILVPMYFFRPFNLYLDSRLLPDLIHLLHATLSPATFTLGLAAAAVLLIVITCLVQLSCKTIYNCLASARTRRPAVGIIAAGLLSLCLYLPATPYAQNPFLAQSFFGRVVEEFDFILQVKGHHSPTFGGASWLAHATLAGGVHLNDQMRYNLLITSQVKPLARWFNDAGYRTVRAMPGTQWPWPEGEFYGYQAKYYAWNFDYRGPMYGWATMPDQYVLEYIRRREMTAATQPLFVEFILVSSHAPFHRQPPYLADWSRIGDGTVYNDLEIITYPILWPDLTNASEGYVAAICYELTVIADFVSQFIEGGALIIILGDHQPNVQLTGENQPSSVPVHVISRNADLLKPFQNRGFLPGLIPHQPPPHRGMETFLFDFLEDFSTPR
ncbi:MAG: hypothetical protein P8X90_10360 [Desulfobacterales bacterium]